MAVQKGIRTRIVGTISLMSHPSIFSSNDISMKRSRDVTYTLLYNPTMSVRILFVLPSLFHPTISILFTVHFFCCTLGIIITGQ